MINPTTQRKLMGVVVFLMALGYTPFYQQIGIDLDNFLGGFIQYKILLFLAGMYIAWFMIFRGDLR